MKRWLVCLHHRLFDRPLGNDGLTDRERRAFAKRYAETLGNPGRSPERTERLRMLAERTPPRLYVSTRDAYGNEWLDPTDWP